MGTRTLALAQNPRAGLSFWQALTSPLWLGRIVICIGRGLTPWRSRRSNEFVAGKIFAEVGQAVGSTELSKLYVGGKLVAPGHQPVPDPGPRPERTRKLVEALLQKFFKIVP